MPWPPPQSALSKDRSRSRLAVSENERLDQIEQLVVHAVARRLSGVMAPLWHESVNSTFHLPWMLHAQACPASSME